MAQQQQTIDINTASFDELANLPMVGKERAQDLIDHRPYESWDDLRKKVPGFSEGMVDDLQAGQARIGNA